MFGTKRRCAEGEKNGRGLRGPKGRVEEERPGETDLQCREIRPLQQGSQGYKNDGEREIREKEQKAWEGFLTKKKNWRGGKERLCNSIKDVL